MTRRALGSKAREVTGTHTCLTLTLSGWETLEDLGGIFGNELNRKESLWLMLRITQGSGGSSS